MPDQHEGFGTSRDEWQDAWELAQSRADSLQAEVKRMRKALRCQHCPALADERSFMCEEHSIEADTEAQCLRDEVSRLREAFAELLEEAVDMRSYVPEYFAKKWKHDEALDSARAVLGEAA